MRDAIKPAIAETVQSMVDSGLPTSLTEEELNALGVIIPPVDISGEQVKEVLPAQQKSFWKF